MLNEELFQKWSKAHIFYDMYLKERYSSTLSSYTKEEVAWRKRLLKAPNGSLLTNNRMFNSIESSQKTYLLHATTKLDMIFNNGAIYSSAGCLVGSIYTTPLYKRSNGTLSLHNLGEYILEEEARNSIKLRNDNAKLDLLVIEIDKKDTNSQGLIGIDYTRLGEVHFDIYESLKYLLSREESFKLENIIIQRIKKSVKFLSYLSAISDSNKSEDTADFYSLLIESIPSLPILGYLYFEALSEYTMLYGQSDEYKKAFDMGEFYNFDYKNFMFKSYEELLKSFNLGMFAPSEKMISEYFTQQRGFNSNELLKSVMKRLIFFINSKLFSDENIDWFNIHWDYKSLSENGFKPLIGHLIHRELRNFNRYQDFYFYFDQFKALQIWNYWNHMDILMPFNGIIPKGEIGINPAYPNLKYKFYKGLKNSDNTVELGDQLDIQIIPRLVDLKNTFMRVQANKL